MEEQSFLERFLQPKVIVGGLVFLAMFAVLISLGVWQASKFAVKRPYFEAMNGRMDEAPLEVDSASDLTEKSTDFRKVELTGGGFERNYTVLIAGRFHEHDRGYWVLTPYVFDDGSAVYIQRGWVPYKGGRKIARESPLPPSTFSGGFVYTPIYTDRDPRARKKAKKASPFEAEKMPILAGLDVELLYEQIPYDGPGRRTLIVLGEQFGKSWNHSNPIPTDEHITDPYLTPMKHFTYAVLWFGCAALLVWLVWAGWTGRLDPGARAE